MSRASIVLTLVVVLVVSTGAGPLVGRPLVTARSGMVTSLEPLASTAGMRILQQGGNAFDAAVATAAAVAVVDPKNSTIGGQGFATVYVAKTREVRALNFFGPAPAGATVDALGGRDYTRGYLATPVPSNVRGYEALLEAHGTMTWAQVLAPAIELAEHGFVVTADFSQRIRDHEALLGAYETSRRVFLPGGTAPSPGDIFVQPDLASTLKAIAAGGAEAFYSGPVAAEIAHDYERNGGLLAARDLASYQARWVAPISTTYRRHQIFTQPPNSSAVAVLLQMNLLEQFDLRALGHNTPDYLHVVGEAMRLTLADRNQHVGDPDFVSVPVNALLSKAYAKRRAAQIDPARPVPIARPGDLTSDGQAENTTHLTVVDRDGNMVSLTQTLGAWFGSGVVAGRTGVLFSNQMRHLHRDPRSPSRLEPGKRPRSNQSPLIVLKDGRPFMALGTPGNDAIWQRLPQVLANVIDFGMDIQSAITSARMIYGGYQQTGAEIAPHFRLEDRVPASVAAALRTRGHTIDVIAEDGGRVNGIIRDPRTGFLSGGADPRGTVYAIGW